MFFKPTTVASMVALTSEDDGSPYDLYSDFHKDAIGCRPGAAQWERYKAMTPIERKVEHKHLGEWMAEDERITAMSQEVARYRFSRRMEYLMRREGLTEREAFMSAVVTFMGWRDGEPTYTFAEASADWEHVCYCVGLPYSDAAVLEAKWKELEAGS